MFVYSFPIHPARSGEVFQLNQFPAKIIKDAKALHRDPPDGKYPLQVKRHVMAKSIYRWFPWGTTHTGILGSAESGVGTITSGPSCSVQPGLSTMLG